MLCLRKGKIEISAYALHGLDAVINRCKKKQKNKRSRSETELSLSLTRKEKKNIIKGKMGIGFQFILFGLIDGKVSLKLKRVKSKFELPI